MVETLIKGNRIWAARKVQQDADFFQRLSQQQAPRYLWIGCADSRVPANEIVGMDPGMIFVHRNVANLAIPTDINFLSVLAFAVNVLGVKVIVVCGHYGCGGVTAAYEDSRNGVIDHWLEPVREIYRTQSRKIERIRQPKARIDALCEYNVQAQVANVAKTTIVRDAWARGQSLAIHGLIYGIADGILRDLKVTMERPEDLSVLRKAGLLTQPG